MKENNFYEILGVDRKASMNDIRSARRRLLKQNENNPEEKAKIIDAFCKIKEIRKQDEIVLNDVYLKLDGNKLLIEGSGNSVIHLNYSDHRLLNSFFDAENVEIRGIKEISGDFLRYFSKLKDITFCDNCLEEIGENLFSQLNIENITIPNSVKYIRSLAFSESKIKSIIIPENVKMINYGAFMNCKNLKTVILPLGLKVIDRDAFAGSSIESIEIPDTVSVIEISTFAWCINLKTVILPSRLKRICCGAFEGSSIESIEIPDTVFEIEEYAFADCRNLKEIKLPSKIKKINEATFRNCINLMCINIPNGVEEIDNPFEYCPMKKIRIPNSVKKMYCDFENSPIEKITLSKKMKELKCIFINCEKLKQLNIPSTVEKLALNISSSGIIQIKFPDNLKKYNWCIVSNCKKLKCISIPNTFYDEEVGNKLSNIIDDENSLLYIKPSFDKFDSKTVLGLCSEGKKISEILFKELLTNPEYFSKENFPFNSLIILLGEMQKYVSNGDVKIIEKIILDNFDHLNNYEILNYLVLLVSSNSEFSEKLRLKLEEKRVILLKKLLDEQNENNMVQIPGQSYIILDEDNLGTIDFIENSGEGYQRELLK